MLFRSHAAAERAVPAVVELGGKSAAVVLPDADIDKVVNATKVGIFSQAGQICSAMSRMIVHKSIKDEVLEKLSKLAASIKVGPGDEEGVDLTPVISEEQLQKVENYARSGLQARTRRSVRGCCGPAAAIGYLWRVPDPQRRSDRPGQRVGRGSGAGGCGCRWGRAIQRCRRSPDARDFTPLATGRSR